MNWMILQVSCILVVGHFSSNAKTLSTTSDPANYVLNPIQDTEIQ